MPAHEAQLWRHPDFVRLWAASTVSLFGSQITQFAVPLVAVLALDATPVQMGLLGAVITAPFLLFGLLAGVWVDRLRRRPILAVAQLVGSFAGTTYKIIQLSLRQAIVPERLQGRMNATMRFIVWGTMPLGALLGGALGEVLGLRTTLIGAALGCLVAPLWVLLSPVRAVREQPAR